MLFDTDLKIELDKDPENYTLQTIASVIEDVFQINCYHYPPTKPARQSTPPTREINNIDEDFELTIQETDHIDLVDYIQSIQRTNESLQQQNRDLQFVPSFSLGIEDNIIHQVCQDINEQETTEPASDQLQTPKEPLRMKSTRQIKLGRYAKSPYIQRHVDISTKCTNEELGIWKYLIQSKDPL